MKKQILSALTMLAAPAVAQESTDDKKTFTLSGYIETYYAYDFGKPVRNSRPGFLYNYNRSNEVNLNLSYLKGSYNTERLRGNLAIATGTYMNANYAAEPGVLKNIYEANIGVRLSSKSNLWLDAGIFPSHIGFESAVGKDNWTLTRSLVAENSPYFESGAKLGYTSKNEKWYLAVMYLNGWQRIQRADGNSTPAFGTQITYKPNSSVTINYSTFAGNDKPDSTRQLRYYHNIYGIFQLNSKMGITAGFDIGSEQKSKDNSSYNTWYTPVLILRYTPNEKLSFAARGEYFRDKNGVIISSEIANGFRTYGFSANADYKISNIILWRTEIRNFSNHDSIFMDRKNTPAKNNLAVTTSLSLAL